MSPLEGEPLRPTALGVLLVTAGFGCDASSLGRVVAWRRRRGKNMPLALRH